ncbi:MAG: hypothetical protein AAB113_03235 [Candidatus Eisenbacteria bacterium]
MGKINWGRVVLGGLLAGVIINLSEYVLNTIVLAKDLAAAMSALGKGPEAMAAGIPLWIVWSFVMGLGGVWLYAAIRPRFGAGPKTAAIAGLALWVIAYLTFGIAMKAMDVMTDKINCISLVWGLVECQIALQLGAWSYKET